MLKLSCINYICNVILFKWTEKLLFVIYDYYGGFF